MQIVIDIPDDDYEFVKEQVDTEYCNDVRQINNRLYQIIANGTVLPKGHGRLADMDEALKCLEETADCKEKQYAIGMLEWAMGKRTLIEADREGENEC